MTEPIVETSGGRLRGIERDGVRHFRGIPYAKPPVGALRWGAPEPCEPWAGVRDATRFGPSAPQTPVIAAIFADLGIGAQDEDCLTLNVSAPASPGAGRPVLVWIHGGAFVIGSGSQPVYDASALVRRADAVVVTVNYRLGALGFLHLGAIGGEGIGAADNLGLRDQIAALEWVRENIEAFGGDPGNVTIFGESAGGMSVGALLGTPPAQGLFRRAIPQSGACQAVHTPESAARVAEAFVSELGVGEHELERLRETPVPRLLEAQRTVLERFLPRARILTFQPVVDGDVLPQHPLAAVRAGLARDVELLAGTTRDEWRLFGLLDAKARAVDEAGAIERIARRAPDADARALYQLYHESETALGRPDPPSALFAFETDRVFRIPALRLVEAQRAHQPETRAYCFTWEAVAMGGILGACHAVDIPFVFGTHRLAPLASLVGSGPEADALAERTMDAWLGFARDGDPAHPGLGGAWPAYDLDRRPTFVLGRECGVAEDPGRAQREAWEKLEL